MTLPLVALPACTHIESTSENDGHAYLKIGQKYMHAVQKSADLFPVMLPHLDSLDDPEAVLTPFGGILFTGSISNVHPDRYGQAPSEKAEPYDKARDATTFPLMKAAIDMGMPVLCICRGFQELNVMMGGTLYPRVHEVEGRFDHRRKEGPLEVQYGPHHTIDIVPGGMLEGFVKEADLTSKPMVNSLHWQGVRDLSPALKVEARAEDGTVEAVSLADPQPKGFLFAVQWHPEFASTENPLSTAMFKAFGQAVRGFKAS